MKKLILTAIVAAASCGGFCVDTVVFGDGEGAAAYIRGTHFPATQMLPIGKENYDQTLRVAAEVAMLHSYMNGGVRLLNECYHENKYKLNLTLDCTMDREILSRAINMINGGTSGVKWGDPLLSGEFINSLLDSASWFFSGSDDAKKFGFFTSFTPAIKHNGFAPLELRRSDTRVFNTVSPCNCISMLYMPYEGGSFFNRMCERDQTGVYHNGLWPHDGWIQFYESQHVWPTLSPVAMPESAEDPWQYLALGDFRFLFSNKYELADVINQFYFEQLSPDVPLHWNNIYGVAGCVKNFDHMDVLHEGHGKVKCVERIRELVGTPQTIEEDFNEGGEYILKLEDWKNEITVRYETNTYDYADDVVLKSYCNRSSPAVRISYIIFNPSHPRVWKEEDGSIKYEDVEGNVFTAEVEHFDRCKFGYRSNPLHENVNIAFVNAESFYHVDSYDTTDCSISITTANAVDMFYEPDVFDEEFDDAFNFTPWSMPYTMWVLHSLRADTGYEQPYDIFGWSRSSADGESPKEAMKYAVERAKQSESEYIFRIHSRLFETRNFGYKFNVPTEISLGYHYERNSAYIYNADTLEYYGRLEHRRSYYNTKDSYYDPEYTLFVLYYNGEKEEYEYGYDDGVMYEGNYWSLTNTTSDYEDDLTVYYNWAYMFRIPLFRK